MTPPIANQICKHCGEPAVEGWVELDGRVTYFIMYASAMSEAKSRRPRATVRTHPSLAARAEPRAPSTHG